MLHKEAEVSHCYQYGEDLTLCTLLYIFLLTHLRWSLHSPGLPWGACSDHQNHLQCPLVPPNLSHCTWCWQELSTLSPEWATSQFFPLFADLWKFSHRQGEVKASYQLRQLLILPRHSLGKAVPAVGMGNEPKGGLWRTRLAAAIATWEDSMRQQLQWGVTPHSLLTMLPKA